MILYSAELDAVPSAVTVPSSLAVHVMAVLIVPVSVGSSRFLPSPPFHGWSYPCRSYWY